VSLRIHLLSALHRGVYEVTGGRLGSRIAGMPVLLLATTGRRTGRRRTVPLTYIDADGDLVLVASYGGSPTHPAWFLNLDANPDVDVQIGPTLLRMRARRVTPEERTRLWPRVVETYGGYARYQARTSREIPLVLLSP
jgi:deazaflavin-dependent oxidoreductase (nitroreductase family)